MKIEHEQNILLNKTGLHLKTSRTVQVFFFDYYFQTDYQAAAGL